jgi:protein gp37
MEMIMSAKSRIEWTNATWNPVVGCTKKSQGCKHCWAKELHDLRHKAFMAGKKLPAQYAEPFETIQLMPERLEMPLHWKKPRKIFVNSTSDLFHEQVPFSFIEAVFLTMRAAPWHIYQILTKRPERMLAWLERYEGFAKSWPAHIWMGVSVEDQKAADERIPHLLKLPAVVRFLSCGPLLGPVNLAPWIDELQLVIVEGESGAQARPMHVDWARSLRDQCQTDGVKFFFKQWGEWLPESQIAGQLYGRKYHRWEDGSGSLWVGKASAGHLLDGEEWREMP